ncbi:DNA ligase [Photobacterium atrarenae]|uniref:DNA ligase n=1 Tax=Photobacterium atrarenae TaxID=865757 RepID=A0ABY5GMQ9_9GAMM|nr:DNA ligase [Photobacterium atrarenae]UTV30228.1 DNA ligase [Photobacterium atrarenae]
MAEPTLTMPVSGLSQLAALISLFISPFHLQAADAPALMKATTFDSQQLASNTGLTDPIDAYFVSEKLDGIRAHWTGTQLVTRTGNPIHAPEWFLAAFPEGIALDGELWAGRDQFQRVTTTVLDQQPNPEQWQHIQFMAFDLPSSDEPFQQRLNLLTQHIKRIQQPFIQLVPQQRYASLAELESALDQLTADQGEGLILQHRHNRYQPGRASQLLKLKHYQDAEAVVIGYEEGKGKYHGQMGSVWVLTADNQKFKIGSGFSDNERLNPPPLGSTIQFRYSGYTSSGLPRFARYIRQRSSPES